LGGKVIFKVDQATAKILYQKLLDMQLPFTVHYIHPSIVAAEKPLFNIPISFIRVALIRLLRKLNKILLGRYLLIEVYLDEWRH
jgi:hypothetical protein